ncbi:hypothetical protein DXG01_002026 [Tephrocybe rancida]|nr:hypothetical protein DXG01_002026 [Tephrocybe rancida]
MVLYQEIYVGEHANALLEVFEQSELVFPGRGFGRQVRHLILSHWLLDRPPIPVSDILRWCPNIIYLTKDDDDITPTPSSPLDLSCIRRFDWVYTRYRPTMNGQNNNHGRDFFRAVIAGAYDLRYLYIAVTFPNSRLSTIPSFPVTAHSLTTLHVVHIGTVLRGELEHWNFPNLIHLITDSSLTLGTMSTIFGSQLEVIEFLQDEALYHSALSVLGLCPNLRELNYHIAYVSTMHPPVRHEQLETIRLRPGQNHMLDVKEIAITVEQQFSLIAQGFYPSLRRIVFYEVEQWRELLSSIDGFKRICDDIRRQDCGLEDENGISLTWHDGPEIVGVHRTRRLL